MDALHYLDGKRVFGRAVGYFYVSCRVFIFLSERRKMSTNDIFGISHYRRVCAIFLLSPALMRRKRNSSLVRNIFPKSSRRWRRRRGVALFPSRSRTVSEGKADEIIKKEKKETPNKPLGHFPTRLWPEWSRFGDDCFVEFLAISWIGYTIKK